MASDEGALGPYVRDALRDWAPIRLRRMFGGQGLFREGRMIALIADEALYIKGDADNLADFQAAGCEPFTYDKQGKPFHLRYYLCPDEALEEPELLAEWMQRGWQAALRAPAPRSAQRRSASASRKAGAAAQAPTRRPKRP